MNFDSIAPRLAASPTEIERLAARIAALRADSDRLEAASFDLFTACRRDGNDPQMAASRQINERSRAIEDEIATLEEAISIASPVTISDIYIALAVAAYRLSCAADVAPGSEEGADLPVFKRECAILQNTFDRAVVGLQKFAGVDLKALGLQHYFPVPLSIDELIEAAKVEADARKS
jgi:hypothetical protein